MTRRSLAAALVLFVMCASFGQARATSGGDKQCGKTYCYTKWHTFDIECDAGHAGATVECRVRAKITARTDMKIPALGGWLKGPIETDHCTPECVPVADDDGCTWESLEFGCEVTVQVNALRFLTVPVDGSCERTWFEYRFLMESEVMLGETALEGGESDGVGFDSVLICSSA